MTTEITCPKCGAQLAGGEVECPSCGVVLAKARSTPRPQPGPAPQPAEPETASVAAGKPAELAVPFKLRRGETDFDVPNLATLVEWARAGRVAPTDYVYNPTLERWVYAREMGELEGEFRAAATQQKSQDYRKYAFACFVAALVCALFAPSLSGILVLVAIVLLVANYAR